MVSSPVTRPMMLFTEFGPLKVALSPASMEPGLEAGEQVAADLPSEVGADRARGSGKVPAGQAGRPA